MIRVFIGFDPREAVAFQVLSYSIQNHSSVPVSITPIALRQLKAVYTRERNRLQSTDFSFTRFLTPYLCGYEGWAIFLDCDMLFLDDIAKLWRLRNEDYAAMVVKHDYIPKSKTKFFGAIQTKYVRKNWSSAVLFNNARCRALSPDRVNSATGLELHQFKWLDDDRLIGELPPRWNHLVGEYPYMPNPGAVHFTLGGPYFDRYKDCDYAEDWFAARDEMLAVSQCISQPRSSG